MDNSASPRLYRSSDYIREAFHLAAATATAGAAGYWVGYTRLVEMAALAGLITVGVSLAADTILPEMFDKKNIDIGSIKKLGTVIKVMARKAGLTKTPPVYDMETRKSKSDLVSGSPAQFQRVVNAAAFGLRNPGILLSEPFLRLTDDEEEKAVMGHEFSHIAGKHTTLHMLAGWLQSTAMFTAMFGVGRVAIDQGWLLGSLSIAGTVAIAAMGNRYMPDPEDAYTREGQLTPEARRKRMAVWAIQEALSIGLLAIPNPAAVLEAVAIEHAFFWAANYVGKAHSRGEEFFADRNAVEYFDANPLALITALRKLEAWIRRDEPEIGRAHDLSEGAWYARIGKRFESLFWTHPQTAKRCEALASIAREKGYDEKDIQEALNGPVDISGLPSRKQLIEEFDRDMQDPEKRAKAVSSLLQNIEEARFEHARAKEDRKRAEARRHRLPALSYKRARNFLSDRTFKSIDIHLQRSYLDKAVKRARKFGLDETTIHEALSTPIDLKAMRQRIEGRKSKSISGPEPTA